MVVESESPKIVEASSKETLCFWRFARDLPGSHSKNSAIPEAYRCPPQAQAPLLTKKAGAPTFETAFAALPARAPALLFSRAEARRGLGEDGHALCTGPASLNDGLRARA